MYLSIRLTISLNLIFMLFILHFSLYKNKNNKKITKKCSVCKLNYLLD
jgi:hypothetical protein